jgi:uncharacterized protein YeeX (DUF496 family)
VKLNRKIKDKLRVISLLRRIIPLDDIKKNMNGQLVKEILDNVKNEDSANKILTFVFSRN